MNATTSIVPHFSAFADFSRLCHERAVAKGFWDEPHLRSHYFVLADGELSEAVEADRIGRWAKLTPERIEELRGLEGAAYAQAFLRLVKDTVEDELADAVIRLADLYGRILEEKPRLQNKRLEDEYVPRAECLAEWPLTKAVYSAKCILFDTVWADNSTIRRAVLLIVTYASSIGIDLMSHIDLKLKYNETRPALHGKKY
jgi:hypothetical protein